MLRQSLPAPAALAVGTDELRTTKPGDDDHRPDDDRIRIILPAHHGWAERYGDELDDETANTCGIARQPPTFQRRADNRVSDFVPGCLQLVRSGPWGC